VSHISTATPFPPITSIAIHTIGAGGT